MDINKALKVQKEAESFARETEIRRIDKILHLSVILGVPMKEVREVWESTLHTSSQSSG